MSDETLPAVVDCATWQARLGDLPVWEKAHTREGGAIAVVRRRLPMVEVNAAIPVIGQNGPVPLLEVFDGRASSSSTDGRASSSSTERRPGTAPSRV